MNDQNLAMACVHLKNILCMLLEDPTYNQRPEFLQALLELNRINTVRGFTGVPFMEELHARPQ